MVSKQVMGWQVGATMSEELVIRALQRAFWSQPPTPGLLVHSDRGGQYCGNAYRKLLHDHEVLRSQSRRGDCYDNAQAEATWSTLKTELLPQGGAFANLEEARLEVAHYLDTYFNLDRRHSALGYRSPHQFEQNLKTNLS